MSWLIVNGQTWIYNLTITFDCASISDMRLYYALEGYVPSTTTATQFPWRFIGIPNSVSNNDDDGEDFELKYNK